MIPKFIICNYKCFLLFFQFVPMISWWNKHHIIIHSWRAKNELTTLILIFCKSFSKLIIPEIFEINSYSYNISFFSHWLKEFTNWRNFIRIKITITPKSCNICSINKDSSLYFVIFNLFLNLNFSLFLFFKNEFLFFNFKIFKILRVN